MKIQISEKLLPYSHTPGTRLLIPYTNLEIQIFPTHLFFENQDDLHLSLHGPFQNFTITSDLEKGKIEVIGSAKEGYFRYFIESVEDKVIFFFKKLPFEEIVITHGNKTHTLKKGEHYTVVERQTRSSLNSKERLSLGNHKAQDWDLIKRRQNLKEIFPIWNRLYQISLGLLSSPSKQAFSSLLEVCRMEIKEGKKENVVQAFLNLFNGHFSGLLAPRMVDNEHQGLIDKTHCEKGNPLELLCEGGELLRSLFFQEQGDTYFLLPCLPPEFPAGRFIHIQTADGTILDIEWSKKLLRRCIIYPHADTAKKCIFQNSIKRFRIRSKLNAKGDIVENAYRISLKSNTPLYLDRFET